MGGPPMPIPGGIIGIPPIPGDIIGFIGNS